MVSHKILSRGTRATHVGEDPPKCPAWLGNVGLMIGATLATLVVIELAFRLFLGHQIVLFPRNRSGAGMERTRCAA